MTEKWDLNLRPLDYQISKLTSCRILLSFCKYDLIEITSWMSRRLLLLVFPIPQWLHILLASDDKLLLVKKPLTGAVLLLLFKFWKCKKEGGNEHWFTTSSMWEPGHHQKKKLENYFKNSLKSVSSAQKQACCKIYGWRSMFLVGS